MDGAKANIGGAVMDMDTSTESRLAALTLHAMSPADKSWMLAQLSGQQAFQLTVLLDELHELGISADGKLLENAAAILAPAPPQVLKEDLAREPAGDVAALPVWDVCMRILEEAQVSVLVDILGKEPASLIARVLLAADWVWSDRFLRALGERRSEDVRSFMKSPVTPPAQCMSAPRGIDSSLIHELSGRYVSASRDKGVSRSAVPRPNWLSGIASVSWLRSFGQRLRRRGEVLPAQRASQ